MKLLLVWSTSDIKDDVVVTQMTFSSQYHYETFNNVTCTKYYTARDYEYTYKLCKKHYSEYGKIPI
jgi:hypothetical protein